MTFILPNTFIPNTLIDANAVDANFNYIIAGMNTLGPGTSGTVTSIVTSTGLTGGPITSAGTIALANIASGTLLANAQSPAAPPLPVTLSAFIDFTLGNTQGAVLTRQSGLWTALAPGAINFVLTSQGPGANLTWAPQTGSGGGGGVSEINSGTGLTGGPITSIGTLSLAPIAPNSILGTLATSGTPAPVTLTSLIDSSIGNAQGDIMFRGPSSWLALAPGTPGFALTTQGAGINPTWSPVGSGGGGTGTVTDIATTGGITGGPITSSGTLSLASIATNTFLSNISASTTTPIANTISAFLDHALGSGVGELLTRQSVGWVALAAGTSGQVLTSNGPGVALSYSPGPTAGTANSIASSADFSPINVYQTQHYGILTGSSSALNTTNFQTIATAITGKALGGEIWLPAGVYNINTTSAGTGPGFYIPDGTIIRGLGNGGGTGGVTNIASGFNVTSAGTLFQCGGQHTGGGRVFENIGIQFQDQTITNVAIDCSSNGTGANTANVIARHCAFLDCPMVFQALNGDLGAGLEQCYINFNNNTFVPAGATVGQYPQILFGGPQQFSRGGIYANTPISIGTSGGTTSNGATGLTCINVVGPAEHAVISDHHISDWQWGIAISSTKGAARYTQMNCLEVETYSTCLTIGPTGTSANTSWAWGVKAQQCHFQKGNGNADGTPVMLITTGPTGTTTSASNQYVNDIEMNNCTFQGSSAPSVTGASNPATSGNVVEIRGGQQIRIIGGQISNGGPNGGAGILFSGPAADCQIIGVSLAPSYVNTNNPGAPQSQQYAINVSTTAQPLVGPVIVESCNMQGYGTPVNVVAGSLNAPSSLQIVNCPGYNDLNTVVTSALPSGGSGTFDSGFLHGYYGPTTLCIAGTGVTGLSVGSSIAAKALPASTVYFVTLRPGQGYTPTYTGTPTILLLGQ